MQLKDKVHYGKWQLGNTLAFKNKLRCDYEVNLRRQFLDDKLAFVVSNSCKFESEEYFDPSLQIISA